MKILLPFFFVVLAFKSFAGQKDCNELNHPKYQEEYVACLEISNPTAHKNCKELKHPKFLDEYISCLNIKEKNETKELEICDNKKNKDCINDAKSSISNLKRDVKKFQYDEKSIAKPAGSLGK